jgi:hypothetical protein
VCSRCFGIINEVVLNFFVDKQMSDDSFCNGEEKLNILERVVINYDEATGAQSKSWVKFRSTNDIYYMDDCFHDSSSNGMVSVDEYTGEYMKEIRANQPPPSPSENEDYDPRRLSQSFRSAAARVSLDYRTDQRTVPGLQNERNNRELADDEDSLDFGPAQDNAAEEMSAFVAGEGRAEAEFRARYAKGPEEYHRCSKRRKKMYDETTRCYVCTCPLCIENGIENAKLISFRVDDALVYEEIEQGEYNPKKHVRLDEARFLSPNYRLPNAYKEKRQDLRKHLVNETAILYPNYVVPTIAFLLGDSDELIGRMTVGQLRSEVLSRRTGNLNESRFPRGMPGPHVDQPLARAREATDLSDDVALPSNALPSTFNVPETRQLSQRGDGTNRTIRPAHASGAQVHQPLPSARGGRNVARDGALSRNGLPASTSGRELAQRRGSANRTIRPRYGSGPQAQQPLSARGSSLSNGGSLPENAPPSYIYLLGSEQFPRHDANDNRQRIPRNASRLPFLQPLPFSECSCLSDDFSLRSKGPLSSINVSDLEQPTRQAGNSNQEAVWHRRDVPLLGGSSHPYSNHNGSGQLPISAGDRQNSVANEGMMIIHQILVALAAVNTDYYIQCKFVAKTVPLLHISNKQHWQELIQ